MVLVVVVADIFEVEAQVQLDATVGGFWQKLERRARNKPQGAQTVSEPQMGCERVADSLLHDWGLG
jgi:hypothetical protein